VEYELAVLAHAGVACPEATRAELETEMKMKLDNRKAYQRVRRTIPFKQYANNFLCFHFSFLFFKISLSFGIFILFDIFRITYLFFFIYVVTAYIQKPARFASEESSAGPQGLLH